MTTATVPPELDDGFVGDMLTQCALALDHGEGSESLPRARPSVQRPEERH